MNAPHSTSRYLRNEDVLCGIALILFAAFIYYVARNYPVGTADSMGPGYFPRGLCYVVAILGLALAGSGLLRVEQNEPSEERLRLRPLIAVSSAFILFGLTLSTIGLLPAIGLLIVICCLAIPKRRFWEIMAIVIVMEGMTLAMWNLVQISVPLVGKF
jgi:hypothetical protein